MRKSQRNIYITHRITDYLDITYRGKKAADGPKYKALGNGFAVPVVAWIAGRINKAMETAA